MKGSLEDINIIISKADPVKYLRYTNGYYVEPLWNLEWVEPRCQSQFRRAQHITGAVTAATAAAVATVVVIIQRFGVHCRRGYYCSPSLPVPRAHSLIGIADQAG